MPRKKAKTVAEFVTDGAKAAGVELPKNGVMRFGRRQPIVTAVDESDADTLLTLLTDLRSHSSNENLRKVAKGTLAHWLASKREEWLLVAEVRFSKMFRRRKP